MNGLTKLGKHGSFALLARGNGTGWRHDNHAMRARRSAIAVFLGRERVHAHLVGEALSADAFGLGIEHHAGANQRRAIGKRHFASYRMGFSAAATTGENSSPFRTDYSTPGTSRC